MFLSTSSLRALFLAINNFINFKQFSRTFHENTESILTCRVFGCRQSRLIEFNLISIQCAGQKRHDESIGD